MWQQTWQQFEKDQSQRKTQRQRHRKSDIVFKEHKIKKSSITNVTIEIFVLFETETNRIKIPKWYIFFLEISRSW